MTRLLTAACASTAGVLLTLGLETTLGSGGVDRAGAVLVTYLGATLLLAAVGMWTSDLRIGHIAALDSGRQHAELLAAVSPAEHRATPSAPRTVALVSVAAGIAIGFQIARSRGGR